MEWVETWMLIVAAVGVGFSIISGVVAAAYVIRKGDKDHCTERLDKIKKDHKEDKEELHARITHDVDKIEKDANDWNRSREESMKAMAHEFEEKLDGKVGKEYYDQGLKFLVTAMEKVESGMNKAVGEIKKEVASLKKG